MWHPFINGDLWLLHQLSQSGDGLVRACCDTSPARHRICQSHGFKGHNSWGGENGGSVRYGKEKKPVKVCCVGFAIVEDCSSLKMQHLKAWLSWFIVYQIILVSYFTRWTLFAKLWPGQFCKTAWCHVTAGWNSRKSWRPDCSAGCSMFYGSFATDLDFGKPPRILVTAFCFFKSLCVG